MEIAGAEPLPMNDLFCREAAARWSEADRSLSTLIGLAST
jgi:hypothetical protein